MSLVNKFTKDGSTLTPLKGGKPTTALSAGGVPPVNNTFSKGQYQLYTLDTKELDRAKDLTPFSTNRP